MIEKMLKCRSNLRACHVYSHCTVKSTKNCGNIPSIFKIIIKYSKEMKAWGRGAGALGDHKPHSGDENQWGPKAEEIKGTMSLEALGFACPAGPWGEKGGVCLIPMRPLPA